MEGLLPIMCAAGLSLLYSGEITSVSQLQIGMVRAFPEEVPNNGFLLQTRPEMWEMGISLKDSGDKGAAAAGGIMWFKITGAARWHKGQLVRVRISACDDDGMLSALESWNAFAPAMR